MGPAVGHFTRVWRRSCDLWSLYHTLGNIASPLSSFFLYHHMQTSKSYWMKSYTWNGFVNLLIPWICKVLLYCLKWLQWKHVNISNLHYKMWSRTENSLISPTKIYWLSVCCANNSHTCNEIGLSSPGRHILSVFSFLSRCDIG